MLDQRIDTRDGANGLPLDMRSGIAQFETKICPSGRWKEAPANARGVHFDRRTTLTKAQIEELQHRQGAFIKTLMTAYDLFKATVERSDNGTKSAYLGVHIEAV